MNALNELLSANLIERLGWTLLHSVWELAAIAGVFVLAMAIRRPKTANGRYAAGALAMALMKLRGFNPEHFALRHPGGRLGRQLLLRVKDTMRSGEDNPAVNIKESVAHMLYQISNKRCQSIELRANRDTSKPSTIPTLPNPTAATNC